MPTAETSLDALPHAALRAPSRLVRAAVLAAAAVVSGCAGAGLETATLPAPSQLSLPSLPSVRDLELPKAPPPVVGTPTEVYERVGRGAVSCWFGGRGPLKGTHVYEASADPAHKGGQAEIYIREKDVDPQNSRGVRAYRVAIRPAGDERAAIETENFKLPAELAGQMGKNVEAWAAGEEGCAAGGGVAGGEPPPVVPVAAPAKPAPAKPGVKSAKAGTPLAAAPPAAGAAKPKP